MRFVLAIAAFFAAAVMIGLGIAQRTVFLEPDRVSLVAELDSSAASYAVIQPDALAAHPGGQSIQVSSTEGTVFAAYGRTADVTAWIGEDPYLSVGYDAESGELVSELRDPAAEAEAAEEDEAEGDETTDGAEATEGARPAPTPTTDPAAPAPTATPAPGEAVAEPAVSPAGSDLWLDQLTADRRASMTVDLPEGVSVIVASGSEDPLPDTVAIAWPLDNSTPWAGPLIVGGAALFLVGAALLISGIVGHKRSRGPRRNVPKGRQKLPSAPKPNRLALGGSGRKGGVRRTMVATVLVVPALALTSCSADYWPSFENAPAPTETAAATPGAETPAPEEEEPVEPVVSVPQWERIMARVATFTADVDQSRDGDTLAQRFTGPALEARRANYSIRAALPDYALPPAIIAEPLTLILPQQSKTDQWPRTVMTVATNDDDETVPPNVLVLTQAAPRENYKVVYAMSLAPDPGFPEVAPASVGAPLISPDYKGLVLPPSAVGAAFASVVQDGPESAQAALFDLEDTELDNLLDAATRKNEVQSANPTVTLDVSTGTAEQPLVALGTIDAGALVSTTILRVEQSRPNDGGTTGFQEGGPARALSGFTAQSAKGVQSTRAVQILFSVPSVGSGDQIRVLGWSESVIAASEIP